MPKQTRTLKAKSNALPFPEWVDQNYPEKSLKRSLLRAIGVLDLAYLFYRLSPQKEKPVTQHAIAPIRQAAAKTAVANPDEVARVAPKRKRIAKKVADDATNDVKIEFKKTTPKPLPALEEVAVQETTPEPAHEPEPLVFEEEEKADNTASSTPIWLDDPRLDEQDLRKTRHALGFDGMTIAFEDHTHDDEPETLIALNGKRYRAMTLSPAMNFSAMLQVIRVNSSEIYVLGRAALGALSGEGYITADEASRIVKALAEGKDMIDMEVNYSAKPRHIRQRTFSTMNVRFIRVDD